MEASDEDEEYSQFRLKKDQDQANEGSEEENSNPDEDAEEGEEEGDEVHNVLCPTSFRELLTPLQRSL